MKNIAIIPARGGSKRIPKKNIKDFNGKPIISYVIEVALASNIFDEVMVSTDSDEIAEIAKAYGAEVPFLRSESASNDFATTAQVLNEVISSYEAVNFNFENACCIYPTAVLLNQEVLKKAFQKFNEGNFDTLLSVLKFSYPIQRGLREENDKLKMVWPENKYKRSQDLETIYHDAGQFYFFKTKEFREKKELFTDNTGYVLLSEYEAQDIDNLEDWKMAELKYNFLNK